jgi:hypothetical protein
MAWIPVLHSFRMDALPFDGGWHACSPSLASTRSLGLTYLLLPVLVNGRREMITMFVFLAPLFPPFLARGAC